MNNTEHGPVMWKCVFMCAFIFSLIQLWTKLLRYVFVYCNEEVFPFQMISKSPYSKINYIWLTLPESQGYAYMHFTSIKTALVRVILLSNFFPLLYYPFYCIRGTLYNCFSEIRTEIEIKKLSEKEREFKTDRPYLWHFSSLRHIFRTEALDSITAHCFICALL